MLGIFNWFGASLIVLSYLVLVIAFPALVVWVLLSVRRSLARIADSLDQTTTGSIKKAAGELQTTLPVVVSSDRRVSNSAFGR